MRRISALFMLAISSQSLADIKSETVNVISQRDNILGVADSVSEGVISHARTIQG